MPLYVLLIVHPPIAGSASGPYLQPSSISLLFLDDGFIGKYIYVGHDSRAASGWFIGRVQSRNLSDADLKKSPSANFVIKYSSKETNKVLSGLEARELSALTHGPTRWWVELQKKAAV